MRIKVVPILGHRRAQRVADKMNAAVEHVPGANPHRFYCVEQGRIFNMVVKYTEGRSEAQDGRQHPCSLPRSSG